MKKLFTIIAFSALSINAQAGENLNDPTVRLTKKLEQEIVAEYHMVGSPYDKQNISITMEQMCIRLATTKAEKNECKGTWERDLAAAKERHKPLPPIDTTSYVDHTPPFYSSVVNVNGRIYDVTTSTNGSYTHVIEVFPSKRK